MAKNRISSSSLFKGNPEKIFDGFNRGAENAAEKIESLINAYTTLQKKLKDVGEAGSNFAKNFDKSRAKDIEDLNRRLVDLVKSQEELNSTIKKRESLTKRLNDEKIKSFYTASDGAIWIRVEKNGAIKVNTFHTCRQ